MMRTAANMHGALTMCQAVFKDVYMIASFASFEPHNPIKWLLLFFYCRGEETEGQRSVTPSNVNHYYG